MASWFQKFLDKLAKANSDAFHGQKIDCCDLNKQNNDQKTKMENINQKKK
ncbi:MAG: LDCC motif putative metal-binding protein [Acetobacterium sp.]